MFRRGWRLAGAALALGAVLGAWAVTAGEGEKKQPAAKTDGLPADLSRAPAKGMVMVSGRPADLWGGALGKGMREKLGKDESVLLGAIREEIGLAPADVERLTVVIRDPRAAAPLLLVRAAKKVNRKAVLALLVQEAKAAKHNGRELFVGGRGKAMTFLDETAYAVGDKEGIEALLDAEPGKETGGLAAGYALAAKKHSLVVAVNPSAFPAVPEEVPDEMAPFLPLLKAEVGTLTVDVGEKVTGRMRVTFKSEAEAKAGVKGLLAGQKMIGDYLKLILKQYEKDKGSAGYVAFLKLADASLTAGKMEAKGKEAIGALELKLDAKTAGQVAVETVRRVRDATTRMRSANNLKQLGLAMHNYHDTIGSFPAAAIYDKDGKALLSWRVLILPYIEQDDLYKQFKLNEAWDSAHNKKLLARLPQVYVSPGVKTKHKQGTFYQVFHGKGTIFDGKTGLKFADITDGTSNTILVAESAADVPWTKPEDMAFDADKAVPKLGGLVAGSFQALFADGSVRHIRTDIKKDTLKAMITRDGGEVIGDD